MSADARGDANDVNALAASLRSHGQDASLYAGMLLNTLVSALPPHILTVERERGLRLLRRGQAAAVTAVTIEVGDRRFQLRRPEPTAVPTATVEHVVRGIVLSRDELSLTEWVEALGRELTLAAAKDAGIARAIDVLISGI